MWKRAVTRVRASVGSPVRSIQPRLARMSSQTPPLCQPRGRIALRFVDHCFGDVAGFPLLPLRGVGDHLERFARRAAVFGHQHAFGPINHWTGMGCGTKVLNLVLALVQVLVQFRLSGTSATMPRLRQGQGRKPGGSGACRSTALRCSPDILAPTAAHDPCVINCSSGVLTTRRCRAPRRLAHRHHGSVRRWRCVR